VSNIKQTKLELVDTTPVNTVEKYKFEPIKGYPMLNWRGKRPFTSTHFYPAQLREVYGSELDGWRNKIYWGDNSQVMSHLLKEYRGMVRLVYIDPPFDSNADYQRKISLRGKVASSDQSAFEEKQYTDIWTNDEYLQFMYERIVLLRELLSSDGSIYLHVDYRKTHYIRCLMDEIFGADNLINELIWKRRGGILAQSRRFGVSTDSILVYAKSASYVFNQQFSKQDTEEYLERFKNVDENGRMYRLSPIVSPSYSITTQG
jgi:adenine-specific DNA-methyltransferase